MDIFGTVVYSILLVMVCFICYSSSKDAFRQHLAYFNRAKQRRTIAQSVITKKICADARDDASEESAISKKDKRDSELGVKKSCMQQVENYSSVDVEDQKISKTRQCIECLEKEDDENGAYKTADRNPRKIDLIGKKKSIPLNQLIIGTESKECNICLMDFEVGDEVSWSPNPECVHSFHKECLVDWLMVKNICPVCRREYILNLKREDQEDEQVIDVEVMDFFEQRV